MNLKDIVNRPHADVVEQDEAIFVIREYVKIREGLDIKPYIETKLGTFRATTEISMMMNMYNHAITWLKDNLD